MPTPELQRLRALLRRPVPAVTDGYRFWRRHGSRIRRARVLCRCADELASRRPRGWRPRSERLYRRVTASIADLGGVAGGPTAEERGDAEWARAAHGLLRAATAPYRSFGGGLAAIGVTLAAVVAALVLAVCLVSSAARHRLFPRDLASGRPWRASSAAEGAPASGVGPSSEGPFFVHTQLSDHPWVEIDLGAPRLIRAVRVVNREDCCQARALPLNVEVLEGETWRLVAQRRAPFSDFRHDVEPVRAQRVRVRLAGTGYLHLRRVSVYGE